MVSSYNKKLSPGTWGRSTILAVAILLLALTSGACASQPANQSQAGDVPAQPSPDPANAGLVARVNGEAITQADFDALLARYQENNTFADASALSAQVLDALIQQRIISQATLELGITITDEEVQAEIDALKATINDEEAWAEFLALNELTEATFFTAQRESLLTQRLRDYLLRDLDGDVMQVRARHILVATEAEANAVLARLQAGEAFTDVAQAVSIDITTNQNGGELGWFTPDELMDDRLADVAFSLQPNQIAGPITTRIGYHIIQTLEKAQRPIEPERLPMLMESVFLNWLDERIASAQIERYR